jgi:hypothetical protein
MSIASHGPRALGAIVRGWAVYAEDVLSADSCEHTTALIRLGYYAGAATAIAEVMAASPDKRQETAEALAAEILDETDRAVLAVVLRWAE